MALAADRRRLLLISSSNLHGTGFLDHAETEIVRSEGAMLRVDGGHVSFASVAGARIFRRGPGPVEAFPPCGLEGLA